MSKAIDVVSGRVVSWYGDEGWGVLESDAVPGQVWCHFSAISVDGYRELDEGETVSFTWEAVEQDSYYFSAVQVYRDGGASAGRKPSGTGLPGNQQPTGTAYASRLEIRPDQSG